MFEVIKNRIRNDVYFRYAKNLPWKISCDLRDFVTHVLESKINLLIRGKRDLEKKNKLQTEVVIVTYTPILKSESEKI